MDAERWKRIENLCWTALERPRADRPAFLAEACGGDAELRQQVESLLRQLETDPGFLEQPIVRLPDVAHAGAGGEPTYIGSYRIVRPIGHGGMGEVYLAINEAEGLELPVAIKMVRRGMDAETALQRFRVEQRILASLRHPHIARLLDVGVSEAGRPFLVMEYVEGTPVDAYADAHRLPLRRRLALFREICEAVQHAHQNLIVHRDLKPSNILVTEEGQPKLLDFGIGKVLAGEDTFAATPTTRPHERVLTPEYSSPEQIRAEPVGTATDVHGLGLLLYKLLTGRHPFQAEGRSTRDVERAIQEEDPPRPSTVVDRPLQRRRAEGSTEIVPASELAERRRAEPRRLRRALAGDLDTIVLKALRKEPEHRYGSAAALAEDVRRHLEGLPVRARRATVAYRTGRFLRRHAWGAAAVVTLLLALAGFSIVTHVQSQRVAEQRDRALEVRGFLLEMFGAAGADETADSVTARQLLDRQAERLESAYQDQPVLRAEMMHVLSEGYERLGLYDKAGPIARDALELRRQLLGPRHPDVGATLSTLGWIQRQRGERDEARALLREAVSILRDAGDAEQDRLARALNDLGVLLDGQGEREEAERVLREALAIRVELLGPDHRSVGVTANNLMALLYRKGEYAQSIEMGERALRALRGSLGPDHQRTIIVQNNLAAVATVMGDIETAERQYRDLLERQTRLQGRGHPVTIRLMIAFGSVLSDAGKNEEAQRVLAEALAHGEERLGPDHTDVAVTSRLLGILARERGEFDEARRRLERALDIQRRVLGDDHAEVGQTLSHLAELARAEGSLDEAERLHRDAIAVYESSLGPDHPQTAVRRERLGDLLLERGDPAAARTVLEKALGTALDRLPDDHPLIPAIRLDLVEANIALGATDAAQSLLADLGPAFESGLLSEAAARRYDTLSASVDTTEEAR